MLIARIFFGLLAIGIGIITLKYNFQIVGSTARMEWIEDKLGYGSTYLVYKIISILLVLGGILYITGWGGAVLSWLISPLAGFFPKS